MSRLRVRDVATVTDSCAACSRLTELHLFEARHVRGLADVLDAGFESRISRLARCSSCAATYPLGASLLGSASGAWSGARSGRLSQLAWRRAA